MKYTVITGASSGIGYETALAFAARGKNVIVVARREQQLKELKQEINGLDKNVEVVIKTADLSKSDQVYDLYESLKEYELETWVNNAGFGNFDPVSGHDLTKIETMLRLNNEALTILSSLFARDYAEKEGTQLINISSGGGYTIVANAVTYCATKFFVSAFTEGLAQELKGRGAKMRAKVLAPAATESEFAKQAMDVDQFNYDEALPKYHTSKEMAHFLLDLYDSDKVVGIVDGNTYEFHLKDPIFPYVDRNSNN
ncbi:UNVERIFIED_CONTAM: SDR family NAD(P)-dependent oxidoreductase [Halobacillus marinus]|uniref:SDR family NAD(P)-dependent oxidoreductase n=1 Tax=Bacillaceae TaxID=186817 RepID=UPI0002A4DC84|nr:MULTISPECIES: SDR family NAD(P)-dependent oxidoreductase [Bacillaceae]ELK44360.1 short-chain dehydrogenase [Halobacillus sp. BAB-2008]QHT46345.1 SDR family NAD(P)-dependent oxidoreductase [Bacillus sp. SB49]